MLCEWQFSGNTNERHFTRTVRAKKTGAPGAGKLVQDQFDQLKS